MDLEIRTRTEPCHINIPIALKRRLGELEALSHNSEIDYGATLTATLEDFAEALEEHLTAPKRNGQTLTAPVIRRRRRRTNAELAAATTSTLADLQPPAPVTVASVVPNGTDNSDNEPLET